MQNFTEENALILNPANCEVLIVSPSKPVSSTSVCTVTDPLPEINTVQADMTRTSLVDGIIPFCCTCADSIWLVCGKCKDHSSQKRVSSALDIGGHGISQPSKSCRQSHQVSQKGLLCLWGNGSLPRQTKPSLRQNHLRHMCCSCPIIWKWELDTDWFPTWPTGSLLGRDWRTNSKSHSILATRVSQALSRSQNPNPKTEPSLQGQLWRGVHWLSYVHIPYNCWPSVSQTQAGMPITGEQARLLRCNRSSLENWQQLSRSTGY